MCCVCFVSTSAPLKFFFPVAFVKIFELAQTLFDMLRKNHRPSGSLSFSTSLIFTISTLSHCTKPPPTIFSKNECFPLSFYVKLHLKTFASVDRQLIGAQRKNVAVLSHHFSGSQIKKEQLSRSHMSAECISSFLFFGVSSF